MHKSLLFILIIGTFIHSGSQSMPIENKTYQPDIKTVLLYSDLDDYAYPILIQSAAEHLVLSFDQLQGVNENYSFTMVLCNSAWEPVNLQPNEYLTGNSSEQITNYTFSSGTFQKFVHYTTSFPTESMNVKYAGNYILKVFRNFNPEDIALTRRCYILNSKTNITSKVHQPTNIDLRYTNQEADIEIDASNAVIPSPYTDAKLSILQNGRYDNAITNLTPKYINGNSYNYDYEDGNLFSGGNEFRAFDTRNIKSVGQNVSTKKIDTAIHITLKTDEARGAQQHLSLKDFNGNFIITNFTASSPNLLEYTYVSFTLNSFSMTPVNNLYVLGAFNNWQPSEEYRMIYNDSRKIYQCTAFMKQGYYNYAYYYLNESNKLDNTLTEGNHFETENDYYIFFYQRNYTYNFDELIGYQKANTGTMERR
jgi:hypothetical protein